jgi:DNA-binding CsgD family transcriptional regulator
MVRVSTGRACAAAVFLAAGYAGAQDFAPASDADESWPAWRWEMGATGETVFEHTRASLRDSHFGMRIYRDEQVPGTLHEVPDPTSADADARAAAPNGKHTFWDVSVGERMPILSLYQVNPRRARYARGVQINLDVAAFTEREREVFDRIVWGASNKEIAGQLAISVKTVESHRGHINAKLGARSAADLVRVASLLGLLGHPPPVRQ